MYFAANQTTVTITVPIVADSAVEPNEKFYVNVFPFFTTSQTVGHIIVDGQGVGTILGDGQSAAPSLSVVNYGPPADVKVHKFYTDGSDLLVEYSVTGKVWADFTVGVYASSDGIAPQELLASGIGDSTPGLHVMRLTPTFDDPQRDYLLMAKVDGNGDVLEGNENNNTLLFSGGQFVVHEANSGKWVVQAYGSSGMDLVSVSTSPTSSKVVMGRMLPAPDPVAPPYYGITGEQYDVGEPWPCAGKQ